MKNTLFMALLLVCSILTAQDAKKEKFNIAKNQWAVGGNFNFNHSNSNDNVSSSASKATSWNIAPNAGYFVKDNLLLGLSTGYSFGSSHHISNSDAGYDRDFQRLSIRPYIRKFLPLGKRLAFHFDGGMSFSKRWDEERSSTAAILNNTETESSSFSVGLTAGLTYSLSKSVYFYTSLGNLGYYRNTWERPDETHKSESFAFNLFTNNLSFGVMFVI